MLTWQKHHPNNTLIRLCRARDLLCETTGSGVPLPDIAKQAGFSSYHFIRVYQAVFGETPHQARIAARLERAKRLLIVGDRSVTEVCLEVGFSSLGTFSSLFARRVGSPPSAYRARFRCLLAVPESIPPQLVPGCLSLMWGWPDG